MTKKLKPKTKEAKKMTEEAYTAPEVETEVIKETKGTVEVVTTPKVEVPSMCVAPTVSEEVQERLEEAQEALETFGEDDMKLPKIVLKDGFKMAEGEEPILQFDGTIVYTKQANAYYEKTYKAGNTNPPDCFSPDGKMPDASIDKPKHSNCKDCPLNKFGSDTKGGDGKACKNTRPTFILVDNDEGEQAIMPKVLRVPPTSLKNIREYIFNLASSSGSYFNVKTRFKAVKKDDYYIVQFQNLGKIDAQQKADVKAVRNLWLAYMKEGNFGIDEIEVEAKEPKAVQDATQGEIDF